MPVASVTMIVSPKVMKGGEAVFDHNNPVTHELFLTNVKDTSEAHKRVEEIQNLGLVWVQHYFIDME